MSKTEEYLKGYRAGHAAAVDTVERAAILVGRLDKPQAADMKALLEWMAIELRAEARRVEKEGCLE